MTAPAGVGLPEPMPHDGGMPLPAPLALSVPQNLRGHYAGFASRFIAFVIDCVLSIAVFELALAAISFAASVLTGTSVHFNRGYLWVVLAFFVWQFYDAYSWTASGKTPGMMIVGVEVVGQDGSHVGTQRGLVRTLAFPLSFLLLGLGFLGILLGRDRRALHDVIAGTAVVYAGRAGGAASVPRPRAQRPAARVPARDRAASVKRADGLLRKQQRGLFHDWGGPPPWEPPFGIEPGRPRSPGHASAW